MALKSRLALVLGSMALLGGVMMALEIMHWSQARQYNEAVGAARYADAGPYRGDYGKFAAAYADHLQGHYQQARIIYAELEQTQDLALRQAVLYNMGNTYLEQAASIDLEKDADRAIPLLELAKGSYRDALRIDSNDWGAKYNLERALQLSPDSGDQQLMDLKGLRNAVRTTIAIDPEGDLP